MVHTILCINSGSSSLKFSLYAVDDAENLLAQGEVSRIGLKGGSIVLKDGGGKVLADKVEDFPDHLSAVREMFTLAMEEHHLPAPDGIGQRVVMGGPEHYKPEIITPGLMREIRKLIPLMPLHIPGEIKGIEAVSRHYPKAEQVACFDTAFHHRMPEIAKWMPLTRNLWHEGIRRYGFHGLSYEYIVSVLKDRAQGRTIIAHLGNGASMAAVKNGMPQDTTMAFSPLGGLMMGTRCGDLDPGVPLYLIMEKGYHADGLDKMLNEQTGLLGVSGISPDMKNLLDKRMTEPHAAFAIDLFCYIARKFIGALSAVLDGLDDLVFTGGIGEKGAPVRWMICRNLDYLGIALDPMRNDANASVISMDKSPCTVRVIPTNEDLMIARHTKALLFGQKKEI